MDEIETRLEDLSVHLPIVLTCQTGKRAQMTAALLEPCQLQITLLDGGSKAWIDAGLPVVRNVKTRWSLERQVRLGAGMLVLIGVILALTVNSRWIFLSAFIGLGLTFAGLTDLCPMAMVLEKMSWNRQTHCRTAVPPRELSTPAR